MSITSDSGYVPQPDDLLRRAAQCDAGAANLRSEAANAAEVLAGRAHGAQTDPAAWAAQQERAADTAQRYAAGLREAATAEGTVTWGQYDQAELVAKAATLGGILIDGRPLAAHEAERHAAWGDRELAQRVIAGAEEKAAAVEATGVFEHVAEDGQVPFWRLGRTAQDSATAGDDDADGL